MQQRSALLQLQMVLALTLVLVLTLTLAPSRMINKKGMMIKKFGILSMSFRALTETHFMRKFRFNFFLKYLLSVISANIYLVLAGL